MSILHVAFYPSDWLAGTRGLSAEETGVYITLVSRIYEMAGPIERDDERLSRLCGCKTKRKFVAALSYLIQEGKLIDADGFITNERAQKEIEKAVGKSDKARDAAESRWSKKPSKNNGGQDANASRKHMPQPCYPEPEVEEKEDTVVSSQKPATKPAKRKSRMREDAGISQPMRNAAEKRGHSQQEAEAQFEKFKNNALAKGLTYLDWDRAFLTWLDSPYFKPIITGVQNGKHRNADGSGAAMAERVGARAVARILDFRTNPDAS